MIFDALTVLAWLMAVCSGLMAGIYLVFSVVIMRSLATLQPAEGTAAMNAINRVIVRTAFMPLFFVSSVLALLMAVVGVWQWGSPDTGLAVTGGLTYVLGMFVVTATANVPLNNRLDRVSEDNSEARQVWQEYLRKWTRWNSARTLACMVTMVICIEVLRA